jgi:hypothetical protein
MRRLVRDQFPLPRSSTAIEDLGCDWLAIVHADGNGLGQVFLKFDQYTAGDQDYLDRLRRFSLVFWLADGRHVTGLLDALDAAEFREVQS